MKNADMIRQTAVGLRDSADLVQALAFRVEFAEGAGQDLMVEANMDLLAAQLEFMQKAVLSLTECVVAAIGEQRADESVFAPRELDYVKGHEIDKTGIVEEDTEEVDE